VGSIYHNLLPYVIFIDLSVTNTTITVFRNIMPSIKVLCTYVGDHL